MKKALIHVKGKVQRVGYRDEVEEIARQLEITGFVENIKPYDVKIVAEGEDSNIERFIKEIKINRYPSLSACLSSNIIFFAFFTHQT